MPETRTISRAGLTKSENGLTFTSVSPVVSDLFCASLRRQTFCLDRLTSADFELTGVPRDWEGLFPVLPHHNNVQANSHDPMVTLDCRHPRPGRA
jgi:hypothetical protein